MATALKKCMLSSGILDLLKSNGGKYSKCSDSKSLITIHAQHLYVWHDEGAALLTVNLNASENNGNHCKKLLPTNPPVFEIDSLLMNYLGNLLALVGNRGVMVIEIPWEAGTFALKGNASDNHLFCRSWTVADRIFAYTTNRITLLQASWYPACRTCTSFMILTSDNYLRLYDTVDLPTPIQVISLGPNLKSSFISSEFAVSLPSCLGENAVSFDFGPVESKSSLPKDRLEKEKIDFICPIYVLHGSGDVYLVNINTKKDGTRSVKIPSKPLSMYPSAEDNYGGDACSILCLHTNPPVLVLAMASGVMYHCVVLDENSDVNEDLRTSWMNPDNEINTALFVHGSVQLPMFAAQEEDLSAQAIRLYRDISSTSKYHCSMVCGVHVVVVSFAKKIEDCIKKDDLEDNVKEVLENDCIVEHLLCTQLLTSITPDPVLGLASIIQSSGIVLICLLSSWRCHFFPLLSSFQSYAPPLLSSEVTPAPQDDRIEQKSFENHIQQILQRSIGAPILKSITSSDAIEPSRKQCLELVCSSAQHLREEYIHRFLAVQALIENRLKILVQYKNQQMADLQNLMRHKEQICNNTETLMEKYGACYNKQEQLFKRIEVVLKKHQQRFPTLSNAETNMKRELKHMEIKVKDFNESLELLKKKEKIREKRAKDFEKVKATDSVTKQLKNMNLADTQLKHVMEILHEEGTSIAKLTRNILNMKRELMLT